MIEQAKRWDTAYEWKAVALLTVGFGLVGLDRWIIAPMFPAIAPDLHLNYQDLGNIIGALGLAWGVSAVVLGGLSDRIGRKRVLIPAIVLFSLLSGFSGVASSLVSLLLIRGIMGVTGRRILSDQLCRDCGCIETGATRPEPGYSTEHVCAVRFGVCANHSNAVAARDVVAMGIHHGGRTGLITAVLLAIVIREPAAIHKAATGEVRTPAQRVPFAHIFKNRNVPLGMLALLCAMTGIFVLSALTPNYLTDYLKLSGEQMGFVISAIGFGGFFGQFGLPGLSDLLGRRVMAVIGFGVGAVFLWLFIHTGANPPLLFALLFGTTIFAFGLFALITGPIATEAAPIGMISSVAGLIIGSGEIFGGGIAPAIAGTIAQRYGIQYVPYFALGGLVLGALVSLFFKETAPRKARLPSPVNTFTT